MLKNKRKFLPVFLTIALVVCLFSGFSSAAAVDTYTVSIYVQEAVRNENGGIDSTYVWVDTPIQVTVTSGETLKDAIDDAARPRLEALYRPPHGYQDNTLRL